MRLSEDIRKFLAKNIRAIRADAKIYLFGSRADDSKRGGDIDILVIDNTKLTLREKIEIIVQFDKTFGEQKLDLISFSPEDDDPFKKVALMTAVPL